MRYIKYLSIFVFVLITFLFSAKITLAGCSYAGQFRYGSGGCIANEGCNKGCTTDGCSPTQCGICGAGNEECIGGTCTEHCWSCDLDEMPPGCGGGGCFTPETKIATSINEKEIKDVKVGEEIISFDIEKGQETTSIVEKIHEVTRSAYYKIKLKNGTEIKVTGEHPLYTIKSQQRNLSFLEYLKTQSLTARLVKYFQAKN